MRYCFENIIGYKEEKEELEIMAFALNRMAENPKSNSYCPRGLLLAGDPGLGKTFFAKTLIDEVGLPTYTIDGTALAGSLGDACKKIRSVFRKAKRQKAAIVFIDEVGRFTTDASYNGFESDTSRTVLSCLLTNMEGIEGNKGIFVIMTANDPNSLDPALIRPGRIDKVIDFYPPTLEDREELFQRFVAMSPEYDGIRAENMFDCKILAKKTEGFSCAAIKSLVAEVGLMLSSGMIEGSKKVGEGLYDVNLTKTFLDRIFYSLGVKKTSTIGMPKDALKRTIVHEIGHAILKHAVDGKWSDIVINSANKGSVGGLTHFVTDGWEDPYATKEKVIDDVSVCLAGRAAEEMFMGSPSSGCSQDIGDAKSEINGAIAAGLFGFDAINCYTFDDMGCPEQVEKKKLAIFRSVIKKAYNMAMNKLSEPESLYIEDVAESILLRKMMISAEELAQIEKEFKAGGRILKINEEEKPKYVLEEFVTKASFEEKEREKTTKKGEKNDK